jgi:lactoylglutathione lyase
MVRVTNIEQSLDFYCKKLGMEEVRRIESEAGRYTNIFLAAPSDKERASTERAPLLELTFNWDPEKYGEGRNFGHLAFEVDDIYATCEKLTQAGITISGRRAMGAWRSSARPTTSPSSCCRKVPARSPRKSRGPRCPTPASGDAVCPTRPASRIKICRARDRVLKPGELTCAC